MHVHGKTSTCAKTAECRGFESSTRGGGTLFVAEKALSGERSVAAFLYLHTCCDSWSMCACEMGLCRCVMKTRGCTVVLTDASVNRVLITTTLVLKPWDRQIIKTSCVHILINIFEDKLRGS